MPQGSPAGALLRPYGASWSPAALRRILHWMLFANLGSLVLVCCSSPSPPGPVMGFCSPFTRKRRHKPADACRRAGTRSARPWGAIVLGTVDGGRRAGGPCVPAMGVAKLQVR